MTDKQTLFRTRFYSDCIGVFQGGGCRAAAFGGAYSAAFDLGVRFIEVAGTSAGAIVAALLAAGASPKYLLEQLGLLDFRALRGNPVRSTFTKSSTLLKAASIVGSLSPDAQSLVKAAVYGGRYSSEPIEAWIESRL